MLEVCKFAYQNTFYSRRFNLETVSENLKRDPGRLLHCFETSSMTENLENFKSLYPVKNHINPEDLL